MASACLKFGLQFTVICLLLYEATAQRNSHKKDELIQDTVRKFLGIKSDERTAVPSSKNPSQTPKYMMDLYEKYRSGLTPMQGNTVRSILAMKDKVNNVDMLIFNLTSLKATEHILQSKLYLLKRRKPKGGKKKEHTTFRLTIGCLPGMASKHTIDISLGRQKPEWHSYDISESVVSCRQSRKDVDSLLGLTLEIKRGKGSFRLVPFKRLIKQSSQPFVLIFSEDSNNQTESAPASKKQDVYGEIGDLLRAKADAEGILPEKYHLPKNARGKRRRRERRSVNSENGTFQQDLIEMTGLHFSEPYLIPDTSKYAERYFKSILKYYDFSKNSRSDFIRSLSTFIDDIRHSLYINTQMYHAYKIFTHDSSKIFQGKDVSPNSVVSELHHSNSTNEKMFEKKVLFSKRLEKNGDSINATVHKRSRRTISDTFRYSTEERESNSSQPTIQTIDENYIKRQTSDIFRKSRRQNRKKKVNQSPRRHKKKRRRNRKLPFWWTRHDSRLHAQDLKQMCKRKSLMVDFSQLGWDDWIISPKSFNAHYCEGSCTFPLIKHTETSNHAAVQSLIHAMGLNTNIPTPSCIPSTTSSLTLLYFDEHGGLVLKSYPNMVVERCGCR